MGISIFFERNVAKMKTYKSCGQRNWLMQILYLVVHLCTPENVNLLKERKADYKRRVTEKVFNGFI